MNHDSQDENRLREIVEECVRRELPAEISLPGLDEILSDDDGGGVLDSMAWVSVIRGIELATGCRDFGDRMSEETRSMRKMLTVLRSTTAAENITAAPSAKRATESAGNVSAVAGWASAVGSRLVDAQDIEKEFGLRKGKIKTGAGIKTVARLADGEDEVSLGLQACDAAIARAGVDIGEVDCVIAASETYAGFPSFGARLHARLLADESCKVFDVGGACVGLLNGMFLAKALLASGSARCVLVASADGHSRVLSPGAVKGEFGGLFGDGASAFVVQATDSKDEGTGYRLGEFLFGCAGTYASALQIGLTQKQRIALKFEGEALARAAVEQMTRVLEDLELRSGYKCADAAAFALHQPNPRLVHLLARQVGIPLEKIPKVAVNCGNLGSSTCGVALSMALTESASRLAPHAPIFAAAVGPGLLWGGAVFF